VVEEEILHLAWFGCHHRCCVDCYHSYSFLDVYALDGCVDRPFRLAGVVEVAVHSPEDFPNAPKCSGAVSYESHHLVTCEALAFVCD